MSEFVIGMDIGYSNLCMAAGNIDGAMDLSLFPAGVAPAEENSDFSCGEDEGTKVVADGRQYVALIDQEHIAGSPRTLSDNYIYSGAYKALFKAALLKSNQGSISHLVTGLPVNQYRISKIRNDLIQQLEGIHRLTDNAQAVVKKVNVIPQPYGAYLNVLNTTEYGTAFGSADVLVIDPGFFSVDWICINRYKLQAPLCGSSTGATSRILEEAKLLIEAQHGSRVNTARLETALRHNMDHIYVGGSPVDYIPFLKEAAEIVAPNVLEEVGSSIRSKDNDVDFVILAGGGASLYEKATRERFPHSKIIVTDNSVMANAAGFYYYSLAAQLRG